jgi:ribonucleotide reductase beta subunit family protein with ferritin-like domain
MRHPLNVCKLHSYTSLNFFTKKLISFKNLKIKMDQDLDEVISETFLVISDPHIYTNFYVLQRALHWTPAEINFTKDKQHFDSLNKETKSFVNAIITYFLIADKIVGDNARTLQEHGTIEKQAFLAEQARMEFIHNEAYTKMFRTINGLDSTNLKDIKIVLQQTSSPLMKFKSIGLKRDFAKKYSKLTTLFSERLAAFGVIECIFFSSSFSGIFWLKKLGVCPGITTGNEWILRDENLHWKFACYWLKSLLLDGIIEFKRVKEIMDEALLCEMQFCEDILPESLGDMNLIALTDYVRWMYDLFLKEIGAPPVFKVKQPFDFMETLNFNIKNNFFEGKTTSYTKHIDSKPFTFDMC